MFFPGLKSLPPPSLGKKFYSWQVKSPLSERLKWLAAAVAVLLLVAGLLIDDSGWAKFLQPYRWLILYSAVPVLSYLIPRAIQSWRLRYYDLHQYGFVVHFGDVKRPQPGTGWNYWKNFDRAEMTDSAVLLFARKSFVRALKFFCPDNRLTVYTYASERIAEARYREVPAEK